MDTDLRRSPLDDRHRALGATMTPFGGWEMPLDYGSVVAEHNAVRTSAGVFDLSHLGTVRVAGPGAVDVVQRAFTNDAESLAVGRAHYTLCLTEEGGVLDDLLVYRLGEELFLVVPNAVGSAAVEQVLRQLADGTQVEVRDVKEDLAVLAVQGPDSAQALTDAGIDIAAMAYLDCRLLALAGVEPGHDVTNGVLARSGYTGEIGWEVFAPIDLAPNLWDRLIEAGVRPVGLGARDTLRLEMGYPLHGNDISPSTSPVEAGLGWAVKDATAFVGRDAYLAAKAAGGGRRLHGLRATARGIPRAGMAVLKDGDEVGVTTSGTFSPTLGVGVALAYVVGCSVGDEVAVDVRGKAVPCEVVRPPFVDSSPKR